MEWVAYELFLEAALPGLPSVALAAKIRIELYFQSSLTTFSDN